MQNTIDILSSINITVKQIAETMSKKDGSGAEATAKLSRGDIHTNADVNPAADAAAPNISKDSISSTINALNLLAPSVLAVANLSKLKIKQFNNVIEKIIKGVNLLVEASNKHKDSVEKTKTLVECIDVLATTINKLPSLIVKAPLAILGVKLATGVIKAIDLLLNESSSISDVSEKIKNLENVAKTINPLMNFVLKATLLVGICAGLGLAISFGPTKELIIGGLATLGIVLATAAAIILLTGLTGRVIKTVGAFSAMRDIMTMVLASVVLVAACFGLGMAIEAMGGWEPLYKGLAVVGATLLMLGFTFFLVGIVGMVSRSSEVLKGVGGILLLTIGAMLLVVGAKYLADFASENWEKITYGLGAVVGVMGALIGIGWAATKALQSSRQAIISLAVMEGVALGAMAIVYLADELAKKIDGREVQIMEALGLTLGVLGSLALIAVVAGKAGTSVMQGIGALALLELLAAGAMGIVMLTVELEERKEELGVTWGDIYLDLLNVVLIITAFGLLAAAATAALPFILPGIVAMIPLEAVAFGMIGLTMALLNLHELKDKSNLEWSDLQDDVLGIAGIIKNFSLLAASLAIVAVPIIIGSSALMPLNVVSLGIIGITNLLIDLHQTIESSGITFDQLSADVFGMSKIMGTFGMLAATMGMLAVPVLLGSAALIPVEALTLGIIGLTHLLIDLHVTRETAGVDFNQLESDVLGMSKIMGTFGLLASAMALLTAPIAIGMPGMLAVSGFAMVAIGVVASLVMLSKAIDNAGGAEKIENMLTRSLPAILKSINVDNLGVDVGITTLLGLSAKYAIIASLVSDILTVAESISKIAQIVGMVDDEGRVRKILSIDKNTGEIKYGDPVDLKNVSTIVAQSVKAFVENSQYSFKEVESMYNAEEIFSVLSTITEPISKFVEMLTGYVGGVDERGNNTLAPVTIDKDGNIKVGKPVDVVNVATTISKAISSFVSELYKKENTENWSEIIYGDRNFIQTLFGKTNKRADSVREVAGVIGIIMDPICKFVDMVSGLEANASGNIRKLVVDSEGNIKAGNYIDVVETAKAISSLLGSFITEIYGNSEKWENLSKDKGKSLINIMDPLRKMIDMAKGISGEDIKTGVMRENANAIMYSNIVIFESLKNVNLELTASTLNILSKIVELGQEMSDKINSQAILTNSKSIVTFMTNVIDKKMPKSEKILDSFDKSMASAKKSLKSFDEVLIKEQDKRLKALDKFDEKLEQIIKRLKDGKPLIDSYTSMLVNTQNYNPNGGVTAPWMNSQPQAPGPYAPQQGKTVQQLNIDYATLSEHIAKAVRDAISGMYIDVTDVANSDPLNSKDNISTDRYTINAPSGEYVN